MKVHEAAKKAARRDSIDIPSTKSLGELLGLTPEEFNLKRKQITKYVRRQAKTKAKAYRPTTSKERMKKKKLDKVAKRRKKLGSGKMMDGTRIDSLETDSLGLRLITKTKVSITRHVMSVDAMREKKAQSKDAYSAANKKKRKRKNTTAKKPVNKKKKTISEMNVGPSTHCDDVDDDEEYVVDPLLYNAIFTADDNGRVKLSTVAICSDDPTIKPATVVMTRNKYFSEIKLRIRRKWEERRIASIAGLREAHIALSSGSLKTCDPVLFDLYLQATITHEAALNADYFGDKERELWKMRIFRKRKSSLDRAVGRIFDTATKGQPISRPMVVGIGDANFPPAGKRGEIAVPTTQLGQAYKRAVMKERLKGRRVDVIDVKEPYTTIACCECGSTTTPPLVLKRLKKRNGITRRLYGRSGRLRRCSHCAIDGKLRDRDVQAARNLLLATIAKARGLPRPVHLTYAHHHPPAVQSAMDELD
jgi:hypothetical protein